MIRVAINGYGRIGRLAHRVILLSYLEEVSLPFQTQTPLIGAIVISPDQIGVNGKEIPVFSEKDPENLPWRDLNVDVVIESTGAFETQKDLQKHIAAGAKAVVLSAPFKDQEENPTYVLGVNLDQSGNQKIENIISNASCK